jgi:serine/threonine protein phosphatase 1
VVHGHTFRSDYRITRLPHRIGIDTGAFKSGQLTALPLAPWAGQELEVAA